MSHLKIFETVPKLIHKSNRYYAEIYRNSVDEINCSKQTTEFSLLNLLYIHSTWAIDKNLRKEITTLYYICDKYIIGNRMIENEKWNLCPSFQVPFSIFFDIEPDMSFIFWMRVFVLFVFIVFVLLLFRLNIFPIFPGTQWVSICGSKFLTFFVWPWTNNIFWSSIQSNRERWRYVSATWNTIIHNAHSHSHSHTYADAQ